MQVIPGVDLELQQLPAPLPIWHARVSTEQWRAAAQGIAAEKGRLVALWGAPRADSGTNGASVCAAYAVPQGLAWLELALDAQVLSYPDVAAHFPAAARMQRASTAKRDQRKVARILAALDRNHAHRAHHVDVDDFDYAGGDAHHIDVEPGRELVCNH